MAEDPVQCNVTLEESNSQFTLSVDEPHLRIKRSKDSKRKVHWNIQNNTGTAKLLKLRNFTPSNPLTTVAPLFRQVTVPARSKGPKTIKTHVKNNADKGTYKYEIHVGSAVILDPEIEIEE